MNLVIYIHNQNFNLASRQSHCAIESTYRSNTPKTKQSLADALWHTVTNFYTPDAVDTFEAFLTEV